MKTPNKYPSPVGQLILLSLAALFTNAQAATYSLADNFSLTANGGSNPWSYGYENVANEPVQFTAFTNNTLTANDLWGTDFVNPPIMWSDAEGYWGIGKNTSGVVQTSSSRFEWNPDEVLLRPKATDPFPGRLTICWTAPTNCTVNLVYGFQRALNAGSVGYSLIKRTSGEDAFLVNWTGQTSGGVLSNFLSGVSISPGDQLFWRIDSWGGTVEEDITKAAIEINEQPIVTPKGSPPPEPYASSTPKQVFSGILAQQENELKTNVLILRFKASRKRLAADPYRPIYHFVSPESQMNDPNGLCFWQERWHLFYQAYPPDEYPDPADIPKRRQHWGHAVSLDLVHWHDLPYAIYPGIERMCFSGGTVVESNRVLAFYPGIGAGQMVAISTDPLLLNWEKLGGRPVKSPSGDSCIWKEGNAYFGLVGADHLVSSTDLVNWTSLGAFLQANPFPLGDAAACPGFVPIGNKHMLVSFSHTTGGQYLLGNYNQQSHKFTPYAKGRFNHGRVSPGGVHAPCVAADGQGGVINILNINDGKHTDHWDQIMSLAQRLTLGLDSQLRIAPVAAVATLRGPQQHVGEMTLPANREIVLNQIQGNTLELDVEIDPGLSRWVRLDVLRSLNGEEQTSITFYNFDRVLSYWYRTPGEVVLDGSRSSSLPDVWLRPPERALMERPPGEPLRLRVFVDRSVVEVFMNERQYLAMRVYPARSDSLGVSLRAQGQGAVLKKLDAWNMSSIMLTD